MEGIDQHRAAFAAAALVLVAVVVPAVPAAAAALGDFVMRKATAARTAAVEGPAEEHNNFHSPAGYMAELAYLLSVDMRLNLDRTANIVEGGGVALGLILSMPYPIRDTDHGDDDDGQI